MTVRHLIFFAFTVSVLCGGAQSVVLPDSLFVASEDVDGVSLSQPRFTYDYIDRSFRAAPVSALKDYSAEAWSFERHFSDLPDAPSEFFVHVLLLHLSKVRIEGVEEKMALYDLMMKNFNKNLYDGLYGPSVVYSGCLDPVEAYRRRMQARRLERARRIIEYLEDGESVPVYDGGVSPFAIDLPDNLLQETDYNVKVKRDGDNPPYRP